MISQPISIHPHCIGRAPEAGPQGKEYLLDGSAYCMDSRGQPQAVVQTFDFQSSGEYGTAPVAATLSARDYKSAKDLAVQPVATFQQSSMKGKGTIGYDDSGIAKPVKTQMDGQMAHIGMAVRRLTPVECERLQGFQENYTAIPWRKKPASECPDGPRYKALGNSWAVPNVRWIGQRIQLSLEGTQQ